MKAFKFGDEIHHYQSFVRSNIRLLGNLIIVSEQLLVTNKHRNYIDILAYDVNENRLVIIELKNVIAGDAIIGQSIRYYDNIIKSNPDTLYKLLNNVNICNINIDLKPKIILVAPDFNNQLLHSISYVKGIDISIVKFNLICNSDYYEVVKEYYKPELEQVTINSKLYKEWNFEEYARININKKKLTLAKQFINYISNSLFNKSKVDVFFYDKRIAIMVDKKIWVNIMITQQPYDDYLDVIINNKDNIIDISLLSYCSDIVKYKILINSIKITFSKIPTSFLTKIT
jgi:hypothetical protein